MTCLDRNFISFKFELPPFDIFFAILKCLFLLHYMHLPDLFFGKKVLQYQKEDFLITMIVECVVRKKYALDTWTLTFGS